LVAAPLGLSRSSPFGVLTWLPSQAGFTDVRHALREYLGLLAGA